MKDRFVLAAVQSSPVYYDKQASTDKACELIIEAGRLGAELVAFSETWLPGYPFFSHSEIGPTRSQAGVIYLDQAVAIPGPETEQLCAAAKSAGTDVVIGVSELDLRTRGTIYCTVLSIGKEGRILGGHRKLKPTYHERTVWGEGSGDDFHVYDRSYGRLSALNCWEHQMVLPGYVMMAQGTEVHIAAWPFADPDVAPEPPMTVWARQEILSRAFAAQGACYVVAVGANLDLDCVQPELRDLATKRPGKCMVIDPRGEVVARSEPGEETILLYEADRSIIQAAKVGNDVTGHYSRPDVLELYVNGTLATEISPVSAIATP